MTKRLTLALLSFSMVGCGYFAARALQGAEKSVPPSFALASDKTPCYLELAGRIEALRMNCFDIDGVLHIHSSRWSNLPRIRGESWTKTILKEPNVRVEINNEIFALNAVPITDEKLRTQILYNRGYWVAWSPIKVFKFFASKDESEL